MNEKKWPNSGLSPKFGQIKRWKIMSHSKPLGKTYAKNLVRFLEGLKTRKIIFEIFWPLKKLEIRAYRPYEEFISDRCKVAKELIAIAKSEHDKNLAQLELIWIKLVKKEDVQKCIENCEKMLKSAPNHCPEIMFLVHFWYAFSLWNKTRQDLHLQSKEMVSNIKSNKCGKFYNSYLCKGLSDL